MAAGKFGGLPKKPGLRTLQCCHSYTVLVQCMTSRIHFFCDTCLYLYNPVSFKIICLVNYVMFVQEKRRTIVLVQSIIRVR